MKNVGFMKIGIDFANGRTKDFQNVRNNTKSDIDRINDQRMPWQDKIISKMRFLK